MNPHNENEEILIRDCQKGDLAAFERLYRVYAPSMLRTAQRLLHNSEDAEDAVQIGFLKLHRAIDRFAFQSKFSTYVYRIVVNVSLDMIAKRQKRVDTATPSAFAGNEPAATPRGLLKLRLSEAIASLPERMRATFVLFAVEGLAQQEIAEVMNVSVGAVKAQVFQAKNRLRGILSDTVKETVI